MKLQSILFQTILHFGAFYAFWACPVVNVSTLQFAAVLYLVAVFSISAGYHRFWAHNSYQASFLLKIFFFVFGSSACVEPIIEWCRIERLHHKLSGTSKDPLSEERGLFHCQIGFRFHDYSRMPQVDMSDLEKSKLLRFQQKLSWLCSIFFGFVVPIFVCQYFYNDLLGGIFWCGFMRVMLLQHLGGSCGGFRITGSTKAFAATFPLTLFSSQRFGQLQSKIRGSPLVSFLCLNGEGYQDFHHEFPNDYRMGSSFLTFDPTKWILVLLSFVGLCSNLQTTPDHEITQARLRFKQIRIDARKKELFVNESVNKLPIENWDQITKRVEQGAKLIVIDGIVYDVSTFLPKHPGGEKILRFRLGKDATLAFNGMLYRHSKAARNLALNYRVSRLPPEEIYSRMGTDHMKSDYE